MEFQLQHESFQRTFRTDFLYDGLAGSPYCPRDSQESSPTTQFKSINSSALSFLYLDIPLFILLYSILLGGRVHLSQIPHLWSYEDELPLVKHSWQFCTLTDQSVRQIWIFMVQHSWTTFQKPLQCRQHWYLLLAPWEP